MSLTRANTLTEADAIASEKRGRELYKSNPTFQNIANLMEHPEFKKLFDSHFSDWSYIEIVVMFMKTYEQVGKQIPGVTPYQKIDMLNRLINNGESRKLVVNELRKFQKKESLIEPIEAKQIEFTDTS
jgi:hypothetical protein